MTTASSKRGHEMVRAGKWIRVSSGEQDEANQEPDIDRHCAGHGYHVAKTYRLHDKSASKGEQDKALKKVLDDLRRGEIAVLVCWHSDRLDRRGVRETLNFLHDVEAAGGKTESTEEGVLTEHNLTTIVNAHMNREKIAHLTKQVAAGHAHVRANGALHGRAPWGMAIDSSKGKFHKQLVPTDEGREWIPRIFARVIDGWSLARISLWLKAEGVGGPDYTWHKEVDDYSRQITKAPGQMLWHESTIGAMIRNPAYMGFRCRQDPQTKQYGAILHRCEPLVSPDVWRRANEALDTRPKRGRTDPDNRPMLSGVLKCGNPDCDASGAPDSPMVRSRSETRFYYRCRGVGAVPRSCGHMVRLDEVDAAVEFIIRRDFATPRMERTVIPGNDHAAELASLKFELQQLGSRDLPWDEEDAERARLRAEYDRVSKLPTVPDQVVEVDTGETYAGLFDALRPTDRGPWLRAEGFAIRASKTLVRVTQGDTESEVSLPLVP